MRARLQAYQTEGGTALRARKRNGKTAQSSRQGRTHRLVTSLQGGEERANGLCTRRHANNRRRSDVSHSSSTAELVKRERRPGLDVDTAAAPGAQGWWACGWRACAGASRRRGCYAAACSSEARTGPDRWGLPRPKRRFRHVCCGRRRLTLAMRVV